MNDTIHSRIEALRAVMRRDNIDLVVIPHIDPHQSEYMSAHWHLREYLSGFSGSAGTLVVTLDDARLWTDSRYFLQAAQQLEGTGITLMKDGLPDTPSITLYICDTLRPGCRAAVDGMLMSLAGERDMRNALEENGIELTTDICPAAEVWPDRPPLPTDKVFVHDVKYCGREAADKIKAVLDDAASKGADATFVSALDEIAWVLNLRGRDAAYNPVVTSFLYLAPQGSTLFIDNAKLTDSVRHHLASIGVATAPYESVADFLSRLPFKTRVLANPAATAATLCGVLGSRLVEGHTSIQLMKGVKNPIEVEGMRRATLRDGVALVRGFMEVERLMDAGERMTEMKVAEILTAARARQDLYFDDSFGTIAGYKDHGAIVHYEADEASDAVIERDGLLLVDSGAQYLDGTTDITRTIAMGTPTADERHDFTLVAKGHIALSMAKFPAGTRGVQLDVLAHQYLWREGKTYLHGTGHGVGCFLNVHEGPQSFRNRPDHLTLVPFLPGMVTTNEPGLYVTGKYGIRCENMMLTVVDCDTELAQFLRFDTLTLYPYDRSLFDLSMMTADEIGWVDAYHRRVYAELSPLLTPDEAAWLADKTRPLGM